MTLLNDNQTVTVSNKGRKALLIHKMISTSKNITNS